MACVGLFRPLVWASSNSGLLWSMMVWHFAPLGLPGSPSIGCLRQLKKAETRSYEPGFVLGLGECVSVIMPAWLHDANFIVPAEATLDIDFFVAQDLIF